MFSLGIDPRAHQEVFGTRVRYSVFECRLKPKEIDRLYHELRKLISKKKTAFVST